MFIYWAFQDVPAGTAQVVLSTVPLMTLFLAAAHRIEPLSVRGLVGALLAGGGIVVIFIEQADLDVLPAAILALLVGAAATVLAKRFPPGDPLPANAVALLCGTALLGALTLLTGEPRSLPTEPRRGSPSPISPSAARSSCSGSPCTSSPGGVRRRRRTRSCSCRW
jgi:drug/metabolite transporter (DMT)-like permease